MGFHYILNPPRMSRLIYSIHLLVYPQPDITQEEPSTSSFCSAILMMLLLGIGSPTSNSAMSFARFPAP